MSVAALVFLVAQSAAQLAADQASALDRVLAALGSPLRAPAACDDPAVQCVGAAVTRLNFSAAGLSGRIAADIGGLSALSELLAPNNALRGELPSAIGRLASLRRLDLRNNALSGPLPADLFALPELRVAVLSGNAFSGAVPASLSSARLLAALFLAGNRVRV